MDNDLLVKLADKTLTKDSLRQQVEQDFALLPVLIEGTYSPKAAIRYGCAKVLMDLSAKYPKRLYPFMDSFTRFLDSRYRILVWNGLAIIANLTKVDEEKKFDAIFNKYFSSLKSEYMVTVANTVTNSGKIALAKPYLIPQITNKLLNTENVPITPHLTEECKNIIIKSAIETIDLFFDKLEEKEKKKVLHFVKRHVASSRRTLNSKATAFLEKWR